MLLQQISLLFELFAGDAVPAFLLSQVDVAPLPDPSEELFDDRFVARVAGADKSIVVDAQLLPERLKMGHNLVTVLLWSQT